MHILYNIRAGLYLRSAQWRYIDPLLDQLSWLREKSSVSDAEAYDALIKKLKIIVYHLNIYVEDIFLVSPQRPMSGSVSDYFAKVLKDIDIAQLKYTPFVRHVAPTMDKFLKYISAADCRECVKAGRRYCCGEKSNDDQNVEEGGRCFIWFMHIAKTCQEAFSRYCGRIASDLGLPAAEVLLQTNHIKASRPHRFDHDSQATGSARHGGTPDRQRTVVTIILSVHIEWGTLATLPYIFLHEILCHANQKLVPRSREPGDLQVTRLRERDCEFAEGWLAECSYRLLELLNPSLEGGPSGTMDISRSAVLYASETFHAARRKSHPHFMRGAAYSTFIHEMLKDHIAEFETPGAEIGGGAYRSAELAYKFAFLMNAVAKDDELDRLNHYMAHLMPDTKYVHDPARLRSNMVEAVKCFLQGQVNGRGERIGRHDVQFFLERLARLYEKRVP